MRRIFRYTSLLLLIFLIPYTAKAQCVTVELGQNQLSCNGLSIDITPSFTGNLGNNSSFSWTYQNAVISSDTNLNVNAYNTGYYYLNVDNPINNCVASDSVYVAFLTPGSISSNQVSCNNLHDTIYNATPASAVSAFTVNYSWESSTDNVTWTNISSANGPNYYPTNLTQDTYFRRIASVGSCDTSSNSVLIDVISPFSLDAGADQFICAGENLNITPITTGLSGGYSVQYLWEGPVDTLATENLTINGINENQSGDYILTGNAGNCSISDTVNVDVFSPTVATPQFDLNNPNLIKECVGAGATDGTISFSINLPQPYSNVDLVTVDWGDGTLDTVAQANFGSFISHTYALGSFQLSVEAEHISGCTAVLEYDVFVGSSPSPATLALFNNQAEGCAPHFTEYTFNVPPTNVDGTTYEVNWGDGSLPEIYTHPNVPATLSHTFTATSCGNTVVTSIQTYENVYQPYVITTNPCSQDQPSASGLISVGEAPVTSFTISDTLACPDSDIIITNTSENGYTINPGSSSCDTVSSFYWTITANNPANDNTWTINNGSLGSTNGLPGNSLFWTSGSDILDISFANPGTYSIELILDNNCGNSTVIKNLCIIEPPQANIVSNDTTGCSPLTINFSENSTDPSCNGSDLPVSYNWQIIQNSTPYVIAQPGNATTDITFTNNTSSVQTYAVVLTVSPLHPVTFTPISNNDCVSSDTFIVEVYPIPQFTNPTQYYLCNDEDLTAPISTNVASNYTWQAQNQAIVNGETQSVQTSNPIVESLSNPSPNVETVVYNVEATSLLGSCINTTTINVDVVPLINLSALPDDTLCVGGTPQSLTANYSGGNGPPTYQWQLNNVNLSGETNATLSPGTLNSSGQYIYSIDLSTQGVGCTSIGSASATVIVYDDPIITNQPIDASYCQNATNPDSLIVTATGGIGDYDYQWYSNTTNSSTGGSAIPGATDSVYIPAVNTLGTFYYYCVVTQAGANCETISTVAEIVINPAPTFSQQPINSQDICLGGIPNTLNVSFANGTSNVNYQWYENTVNANTGGILIAGATSSSYTPPALNVVDTFYYYCVITFNSGGCSEISSNTGEVIVHPDPVITNNPLFTDTICVDGAISSPLTASYGFGVGTPSYQWYHNGIQINGATALSYSPGNFSSVGNEYYSVEINLSGIGCDAVHSDSTTIVVIDDPIITQQPVDASYCQNANNPDSLIVLASGGFGSYNYQWFSNTSNSTNGGTLIVGATDSIFTPFVNTLGTQYYYCVVSQNGSGCEVTSNPAAITINPAPIFTTQPTPNQEICLGGSFTSLSVTYSNGTGTPSYQWYENSINSSLNGTLLPGETTANFQPTLNTVDTMYYYCIITFTSGGCSEIVSNTGQAIVHPDPIISTQPLLADTLCEGGTLLTPLSAQFSFGVGSPSYQWYLNGASISGETNSTFTPMNLTNLGSNYYSVKIQLSGAFCNAVHSDSSNILVVPDPQIVLQPQDTSYCINANNPDSLITSAIGGFGDFSYQWYENSVNNTSTGTLIPGATDSVYVPSVNAVGTTYYYCEVSQTGAGCSVFTNTASVEITPQPIISAQPTTLQEICEGGVFNPISVAYINGTGTPTYQWFENTTNSTLNGTLIPGETNSTFTPLVNTVDTLFYYCVINFSSGGCSEIISNTAQVIVHPDPTISTQPLLADTLCEGGTLVNTLSANYTLGTGTPSYQWYENGAQLSGETNSSFTPSTFNTAGDYYYHVEIELSGNGCEAVESDSTTITVVPDPQILTQPISASYCENASFPDTLNIIATGGYGSFTYQWFSNTSAVNSGGTLIPGATDSIYVPSTSGLGTIYYYCVISQNGLGCEAVSDVAGIVINPAPTFTQQPTPLIEICEGGNFGTISVSYTNGTGTPSYQWYENNINSTLGGALILGETNLSYTPTLNVVDTLYYYCVISFSSGGCSEITSNVTQAIVHPNPVITTQPLPVDTICIGGSIAAPLSVGYDLGLGTPSYEWFVNGNPIANSNTPNFTPASFNATGDYFVYVTVSLSGNGCNTAVSDSARITVLDDPTITTQPVDANYCQNAPDPDSLFIEVTGGFGNYNYQWFVNTTNSTSGGSIIAGANNAYYFPPMNVVGTNFYYCVVTQSGANCEVVSNPAEITVSLAPTFIITPLVNQDLCLDGTSTILEVDYQNGTSSAQYQWFVNTTNSTSGGQAITGANTSQYTPPSDVTALGTHYYYCEISFNTGGCSEIISPIATVTVHQNPTITTQPLPMDSICVGGTVAAPLSINYSSGTGSPSFQWYENNQIIPNANNATYTPANFTNAGSYYYSVELSLSGSGCDLVHSDSAQIVVVDDPEVILQPKDTTYCQNTTGVDALSIIVTGGLGDYSYQWFESTSNSNTGGTPIIGETDSSYIPPTTTVGTQYYYCEVNQTGLNCATVSDAAVVQINLPPSIDNQPLSLQEACLGGTINDLTVSYINGTGNASYQWFSNSNNANFGGTPITGANNANYTPNSSQVDSVYYYCEISFQSGGCSSITSDVALVVIHPDPSITSQPISNQVICLEDSIPNTLTINHTGGVGNPIYQWYEVGSPDQLISGATGLSYTPFHTQAGNYEYYITLSYSGSGCGVDTSSNAQVTVNPLPHYTGITDTLICNNEFVDLAFSSNVNVTYSWVAINNPNVEGESLQAQSSSTLNDSLSNTSSTPQVVSYILTPISTPDNCAGHDTIINVTVQPDVLLNMPTSVEICSGSAVNTILSANIPSTFSWFVSVDNANVTGESIQTSTNTIINDILTNTSSANQVVIYSVFPTSINGDCVGEVQTLAVTVKPPIELLSEDTLTICSETPTNINLVANSNVSFNWYADPSVDVLNETTNVTSGSFINDNLENTSTVVQEVNYHVIATSSVNGCSSPIIPLSVFVNPKPEVFTLIDTIFCKDEVVAPISFTGPVNGSNYNWTATNTNVGFNASSGQNSIAGFIAENNSTTPNSTTVSVTPQYTNNGVTCSGDIVNFNIQVLPETDVNPIGDIAICDLLTLNQVNVTGNVPNTDFTWNNNNTAVGLNANGIGDIPSFIATNNTNNDISATVTITPSYTVNNTTCNGIPEDYDITVNPSPKVLNTDIEICSEEQTNIQLNATLASQFEWQASPTPDVYNETSFPLQNTSLINDNLINYTNNSQVVQYTVNAISNAHACVGPDSIIEVTVHPLPELAFEILSDPLCEFSPVNFQNNSIGNLDYMWYFGDGDSSFLVNPSHVYDSAGAYTVELFALNPLTGCTNTIDTSINMLPIPSSAFSISDSVGCGILDVLFIAETTQPSWNYSWTIGDVATSQQFGLAAYQFTEFGCHDINLTVTDNSGCASTSSFIDGVCLYEEPVAEIFVDDNVVSSFDPTVQFLNYSQHATAYQWNFGDNTGSIVEHPIHTYSDVGQYYIVSLIASNTIGCADTARTNITIKEELLLYVPNSFTPNNDDYNNVFQPILTQGYKKGTYVFSIYNRWGELVFETSDPNVGWNGSVFNLGTEMCKDGTYVWTIAVDPLQSGDRQFIEGHVNLLK